MGKRRFTDISKWRNEWFRTLPQKAKLAWIYLCDECDFCGIWKADYGLASFQLDFPLTNQMLRDWFGSKIHIFDGDKVLLLQFFEFQYGESKDSWTAKVKARERLETLGFSFVKNKILIPQSPTVDPQSTSVLIVSVGEGVVEVDKGESEGKISDSDFEAVYQAYPRKEGKSAGIKKLKTEIKTKDQLELLKQAVEKYRKHVEAKKTKAEYIKLFSTFANHWREVLEEDWGTSTIQSSTDWDPMTVPLRGA